MTAMSELSLNDGRRLPQIGFGTWPLDDNQAAVAVAEALRAGYRLVDTAVRYGNEVGVGRGVRDSGVPREEVILATKIRGIDHGYDSALRACEASLKRLGTEYLDLYLIHWPLPTKNRYVETWRAFIRLREQGLVRSIGVSNFQPAHIHRLVQETGVWPAVNQVEIHPDFSQPELRQWHAEQGIVVESWSPLGLGELLKHPVIQRLAEKHHRTAAQVVLRWHLQLGLVAIPKSQHPERIRQNFAILDFQLDKEDLAAMSTLDGENRLGGHPDTFYED